ncbi:MAG: hypothetical protein ABL886_12670, partial [Rhodoglobus sp.]
AIAIAAGTTRLQVAWAEGTHIRSAHLEGGSWVQDGGDLEVDVAHSQASGHYANRLSLAFDGDVPWIAWHESGALGFAVYAGRWNGAQWVVLGGHVNAAGTNGSEPQIAIVGGTPYVALIEAAAGSHWQAFVRRWGGSAWESVGGSLNSVVAQHADLMSMAIVGGKPTVAFRNVFNGGSYRVFVRQWSGASWDYLGDPVAGVPSSGYDLATHVSIAADGDVPYVSIAEVLSQADNTLRYRVAHYNPHGGFWKDDIKGPSFLLPQRPQFPEASAQVIGGRLFHARAESDAFARILTFE